MYSLRMNEMTLILKKFLNNYRACPIPEVSAFMLGTPVVSVIIVPGEEVSFETEVESVVASAPVLLPQEANAPKMKTISNFFMCFNMRVLELVIRNGLNIIAKIKPSPGIGTASNDCLPYENLY
ncbi:MAG: hypothetical protein JWQ40_566 [Segetibacter sp.]|nr:hypothetical protein [Segetibacter sp.]